MTAGLGSEDKVKEFKEQLDDYSAILLESLADRLAEAFAERLHERVRTEFWGYAPDEKPRQPGRCSRRSTTASGPPRATRPAPTTPRRPPSGSLLDVEKNTGITLTESMAMWPGASVSGFYFSHPQSQYFVRRPDRQGPGRGLRRPQGHDAGRGGAVALAEPRLRARGLSRGDTPAAVLWDMDGTLVDTEPYWIESEFELIEEHGGTWSHEHAMNLVGNDLLESGRYIRRAQRHRPRRRP